jgi:FkbM family methyltransferase
VGPPRIVWHRQFGSLTTVPIAAIARIAATSTQSRGGTAMLGSLIKDLVARTSRPREGAAGPAATQSEACDRWLRGVVLGMFERIHRSEPDNFDADRFRGQAPNAFFHERHADYFLFLLRNAENFFHARQMLEDERSRTLFDDLVLFRVLGHMHVRLPFNTPDNRALATTAQSWWRENTDDTGPFGPLAIFVVPGLDGDIRVKGWKENIAYTFLYRQYYFERGGIEVKPTPNEHVIDAGGCFGDTALGFADSVGPGGHVYVFDPLPKHCAIMRQQLAMNPKLAPRVSVFPFGLAEHANDIAPLPEDGIINPGARIVESAMPMTTIDETVARADVARIDFIKMDIEGSELAALRGAESSIRRWRPKLAISIYHRPEDFFVIPSWIDSLGLGYRFHLDHYSIHNEETVLYATA